MQPSYLNEKINRHRCIRIIFLLYSGLIFKEVSDYFPEIVSEA